MENHASEDWTVHFFNAPQGHLSYSEQLISIDDYWSTDPMRTNNWGDSIELFIAARMYHLNFAVFNQSSLLSPWQRYSHLANHSNLLTMFNTPIDRNVPTVFLVFRGGNHYDLASGVERRTN